jgi:shikimate dehydrogenase
MLRAEATRLAVWGDPIAHSRSPQLHAAAYRVLGLPWTYERQRVTDEGFDSARKRLDDSWRGLSLTMPLKHRARQAAAVVDRAGELSGAVNTLLLAGARPLGFNTDVAGLVAAIRETGVEEVARARILGAGATATSALLALEELGARTVEVAARRPEAVAGLRDLGARIGVAVSASPLSSPMDSSPELTISTLPGDAALETSALLRLVVTQTLLVDVVYGVWPTPLASAWHDAGGTAVSGLPMLLHQAVRQVRIFVTGTAEEELPHEDEVVAAMRRALMED